MKFGKRLKYECIVEWEEKYVSYAELKKLLNDMRHGAGTSEETSLLAPAEDSDAFFNKLNGDFSKVNAFFSSKQHELDAYFPRLTEAAALVLAEQPMKGSRLAQLRTAFREFYRGLCMLQNYVELNHEGFRKILKKHDRMMGISDTQKHVELVNSQPFWSSKTWKDMMEEVEDLYIKAFKVEKRADARLELLPQRTRDTTYRHMLKLGIGVGVCIALFFASCMILFSRIEVEPPDWARFISVIPVYRMVAIPLLAFWFWGVNVYIWSKFRVNYVFIFGLDPRTYLDFRRIFKSASILTAVWLLSFFLFIGSVTSKFRLFGLPSEVYPLMLVIFVLTLLLFPFRAFHRKSRVTLFFIVCNVLIAPFGEIKFRHLYIGDVLTSMVKTLFDVEYTICYYVTGDWLIDDGTRCTGINKFALPILSGLPLFLRLMQCLKRYKQTRNPVNLGNAGKYFSGCSVVITGALNGYQSYPAPWTAARIVWCACFVLATLYMYTWDIKMDWGLGKPSYYMLRSTLLYSPHVWAYYWTVFTNIVMRFAWAAYVTPAQIDVGIHPEFFVSILSVIEIYRRFQWSVFRVEYEQIVNTGDNRAHIFAPLPGESQAYPLVAGPATRRPFLTSINGGWIQQTPLAYLVESLRKPKDSTSPTV